MSHDEPRGADGDTPGEGERDDRGSNLSRRKLVTSGAATWATVSLAGCYYITDPGPEDEGGGGNGGGNGNGNGNGGNGNGNGGNGDGGNGDGTPDGTADGTPDGTDDGGGSTTVTSEPTTTEGGGGSGECASIRRFAAGMDVALNVDVFDQDSGQHLGAESVETVRVEFPNADFGPLELDWSGPHEEFTERQWGGKLSTREDTDPGTYQYEIVVEGDSVGGEERIADRITIV